MATPLRLLVYGILALLGLAAGRYVVPATRSVFARGPETEVLEAARSEYWKGKVDEILASSTLPEQRMARGVTMLERMTTEEFPAVMQLVQEDESLQALLATSWAETDPSSFFKYLTNQSDPAAREMKLAATLITRWAQRDFRAAAAAASRLRVPGVEPDPFKSLALAQLRGDVRKGLEYLQQQNIALPDAVMFRELEVTNLKAPQWQGLDVHGRMEFLQTLPASPWQALAVAKLSELWLQQSPQAILQEAQQTGKGMAFVAAAAGAWTKQDAAAAGGYYQGQAKGQVRALLGLALAKQTALSDAQAAWDFTLAELGGEPRVQAQEFILTQVLQTDPAEAWEWLKDLPNAPWRQAVLVKLNATWLEQDPTSAQAWRQQLRPQEQKMLSSPVPPK